VLVAPRDRLGAGVIEADLVALAHGVQVGPLVGIGGLVGHRGGRARGRPRLQLGQQLALADGVPDGHGELAHDPVDVGQDLVLHLHRLEHDEPLAGDHVVIAAAVRRDHRARKRGVQREVLCHGR